jgi:hypothetical protein
MLEWLSRNRLVRGCTAFLTALLVYVTAVLLAYMLIVQVATLAASGA